MVNAPEMMEPMVYCDACGHSIPGFDAYDHFWDHRAPSFASHESATASPAYDDASMLARVEYDWAFDPHGSFVAQSTQLPRIDMTAPVWPHWAASVRARCSRSR